MLIHRIVFEMNEMVVFFRIFKSHGCHVIRSAAMLQGTVIIGRNLCEIIPLNLRTIYKVREKSIQPID